jgi:hypothetical protein
MGLLGPPIYNKGLCSSPGEDPNARKQFGPQPTWAIEPRYRPDRLVSDGFWMRDYGGGVRVGRPFGARWRSPVRGSAR